MGKVACIVKILGTSATSFAAVDYNEKKVAEGVAKCVAMENFGLLEQFKFRAPDTVKKYLEKIADKNDRVEHPQLHFTISYPGKATEEEKKEIEKNARDMLGEMGYGSQPLLLYWHSDTECDHLHGVSVRVDQTTGKWINNKFEGVNARRILDGLRGIEHDKEIDRMVKFDYTSRGQFTYILHANGYHFTYNDEDDSYGIYRASMNDTVSVLGADIDRKAEENRKNKKTNRNEESDRLKVVRGIIRDTRQRSFNYEIDLSGNKKTKRGRRHSSSSNKHDAKAVSFRGSNGLDMTDLQKAQFKQFLLDIKRKAGIEILFHRNEDGLVRGYTVIDNAKGHVFNGSEIMKLNALLGGKNMDSDFVLSPELAAEVSENYRTERNNKLIEKQIPKPVRKWHDGLSPYDAVLRISRRLDDMGIIFNPKTKAMTIDDSANLDANDILKKAISCVEEAEEAIIRDMPESLITNYANEAISLAKLAEQIRYPDKRKTSQIQQKPESISKEKAKHTNIAATPVKSEPKEQTKKAVPVNIPSEAQKERMAAVRNTIDYLKKFILGSGGLFDDKQIENIHQGIIAQTIDSGSDSSIKGNLEKGARELVDSAVSELEKYSARINTATMRIVQVVGEMVIPQDISVGGASSNNDLPKKKDDEWDRWKRSFFGMHPARRRGIRR